MSNQLTDKNTFLFSTGGTPVSTDVITTSEKVIVNPKSNAIEYKDYGNGAGGNTKTYTNDDYTTADFKVPVDAKASGTAGVAPRIAELLKACSLKETINAGTDVIYTPELGSISGTAKAYVDGEVREITGIAGNVSFSGELGSFVKFSFDVKGFTTLSPELENNPIVTLDLNEKLLVKSATAITFAGNSINLKSFEFNTGNEIKETYATGLKEYYVQDFKPTIKIKAVKTKSNNDHWTELKSNSLKEIVINLGTESGKKLVFKAPKCNASDVSENDEDGKMIYEKTLLCQSNLGNDNYSLTYK